MNEETARVCVEAGATILVAGSAVFNQDDRKKAISLIKSDKGNVKEVSRYELRLLYSNIYEVK